MHGFYAVDGPASRRKFVFGIVSLGASRWPSQIVIRYVAEDTSTDTVTIQPWSERLADDLLSLPDYLLHRLAMSGIGRIESESDVERKEVIWRYISRRNGSSIEFARTPDHLFRIVLARWATLLRTDPYCAQKVFAIEAPAEWPSPLQLTDSHFICAMSRRWRFGLNSICTASMASGRCRRQTAPAIRPAHNADPSGVTATHTPMPEKTSSTTLRPPDQSSTTRPTAPVSLPRRTQTPHSGPPQAENSSLGRDIASAAQRELHEETGFRFTGRPIAS